MKNDDYYVRGNRVVHAKTGKSTPVKQGKVPVVVHKGELVVTGRDVAKVKHLLRKK